MPTFAKRGKKWRAQVRVKDVSESATFDTKREAQRWAYDREESLKRGHRPTDKTLGGAFLRYAAEVTPTKKGHKKESIRLEFMCRDPIASIPLSEVKAGDLAKYRDRRLKEVKPSTVNRDLNLISGVLNVCVKEWHWLEINPCSQVKRPKNPPPRDRRITDEEIDRVCGELFHGEKNREVADIFLLALETAMRLSEICELTGEQVHEKYLVLLDTKNGDRRNVPLTSRAREILAARKRRGPLFSVNAGTASTMFRKAVKRAAIDDLHFHDSRHEAITRLARKLDVLDLARMIGHRDPSSLMIYYNARPDEIADRLG